MSTLAPAEPASPGAIPTPVVFSWSAGKDSAFGLWTLLNDRQFEVVALLTTLTEGYRRVSMSGVREQLLDRQAEALDLPLVKVWIPPACPNLVYEERMRAALASDRLRDIRHFAFGDLYLADVRAYREERLSASGRAAIFPLWGRSTAELAREMIAARFRATIVCVDPRVLPPTCAGRAFDEQLLAALPEGVDPCGENGEFHSFVWDAPIYSRPVACHPGEVVTRDGFVFADLVSEPAP
ncbi:MAG: ATP-binding protein [Candidatus Dormibacteria bacterium]